MDYLLDTHTLLRALFEPTKLGKKTRKLIEDTLNSIHVSPISYWEISLKHGLGKLILPKTDPSEIPQACRDQGFTASPASADVLSTFHQLPVNADHRDPFKRLIIWQAIQNGHALVSRDRSMAFYIDHGLKLAK
ncbi:type II toxin-antitoxin system VapC family toxin [Akkermansiaceae bacterium]|nr:type II toxin-antitoxin system VapC family toxin [Akkermansiaceae bacterium]